MNAAVVMLMNLMDQVAPAVQAEKSTPYSREHIFYSVMKYCRQREDIVACLDMFYYHDLIKKMVGAIRNRQSAQAQHFHAALLSFDMQVRSTLAWRGMEALYFPALALKYFRAKDYDRAAENILLGLAAITSLHDEGCKEAIFAAVEQQLNLLRVNLAAGFAESALHGSVAILSFLHSGHAHELFMNVNLGDLCLPEEHLDLVKHYTDGVLLKILHTRDTKLVLAFFDRLDASCRRWDDSATKRALLLLQLCANPGCEPENEAAHTLPLAAPQWSQLPQALQYLLVLVCRKTEDASTAARREVINRFLESQPLYEPLTYNGGGVAAVLGGGWGARR